jgi:hypothetical protein
MLAAITMDAKFRVTVIDDEEPARSQSTARVGQLVQNVAPAMSTVVNEEIDLA